MCYIFNVRKQISEAVEAVGNRDVASLMHVHQRCKNNEMVRRCPDVLQVHLLLDTAGFAILCISSASKV